MSDDIREMLSEPIETPMSPRLIWDFNYAAWRFRMWVAGHGTYPDIDAAVGRGDIQPGTDPESIGGLLCHSALETERGSVQCTIEAGHERDHEGSIGEPGGEYIQVRWSDEG